MNKKVLKTLEFNKIVEKLADYASSPIGKELCEQTLPLSDINEITKNRRKPLTLFKDYGTVVLFPFQATVIFVPA